MKKLLLVSTVLFSSYITQAQCTPDMTETVPGMHPTQAEGLSPATVGTPYSQTITVIIPADTTIELVPGFPTTVPINSAKVNNVIGLPSGFSYACNPSTCIFPGGTTKCAVLTGTATSGQEGIYPLKIAVTYDAGLTADDTVEGYNLVVNPMGVFDFVKTTNTLKSWASPNPFVTNTDINFIAVSNGDVRISVYNLLGKNIKNEVVKATTGENSYTLRGINLQQGVYMVEVSDGKNKTTHKLIKQ